MKNVLLLLVTLLICTPTFATHIIGGSLTYEHLGGSSYNVKLKLYRDCDPASFDFPPSVDIIVRDGDGNGNFDFNMVQLGRDTLDPLIDTCAVNPGICVEEAIFSKIVSLPPSVSGYHMYWQVCCRNASILNLDTPLNVEESFHTYIPNLNLLLTNSSPSWTSFPPVFVCQGIDVNFDHGATDPDGDSLVYSLYTPYDGDAPTYNGNPYPDNIQFTDVPWEVGFSQDNPLNNGIPNSLTVSQTGLITGIPNNIGNYVLGIKCEEYRDGVKIGVIVRDFQFNVIDCPPVAQPFIVPITACSGFAVQFENGSINGAEDFLWNFGDNSTLADTSYLENPSYSYPSLGDYDVTLIAQRYTPCADTTTYTIQVAGVVAAMPDLDSTCIFNQVNFMESSTATPGSAVNSWEWNFEDGGSSAVPNPSHSFTQNGDMDVQLIVGTDAGCFDTITKEIFIQGLPSVNVGPDTNACFNSPASDLNGLISNAGGGFWVGDGGTFLPNPSDVNANYSPTQAEIDAGFSQLILSSTENGFCPSSQDTLVINYIDVPTIDAGPDIQACKDTASVSVSATFQYSGGVEWFSNVGTGTFDNAFSSSTLYYPSTADTALGVFYLYVKTIANGSCEGSLDSLELTFFDPPTVNILTADTICSNEVINLNANSTTGNGHWISFGDGDFSVDTANVTSYQHGAADETTGNVTLIFNSLNNGGCKVVRDTVEVEIIPAPNSSFFTDTVCFGEETSFTSTATAVEPIIGYDWQYQAVNSFGTNSTATYSMPDEGGGLIYHIVESQNGCEDTAIVSIPTHFLPDVNFGTPAACLNGGTQYYDSTTINGSNAAEWLWEFGDGSTANNQNGYHIYDAVGTYSVTLTVTSDAGCVDSYSEDFMIQLGPQAAFTAVPDIAYIMEEITFTDQSTSTFPIVSWDWEFGDGAFDDTQNTSHSYESGGEFDALLIIEDNQGCIDTAKNTVTIYLPPIVPSGFSPNGDGPNDLLFVYGGPYESLQFNVYNNWGELIFSTDDETIGWDGKFKGIDQPIGVYVWTVKAVTADGVEHTNHGDTTLTR